MDNVIDRVIDRLSKHIGKYEVDAPRMYAKESSWCTNITPNRILHTGMCLDAFCWGRGRFTT